MARQPGDKTTLDLLAWEPTEIVERFEEVTVRAASLRSRIAKAVSETLKASQMPRGQLAAKMSEWLGEDVTKNMLDAYASEAREEHTIPFLRVLALLHVTGDVRLLQLGAEMFGHSVIDDKYLSWVEVGQLADTKIEIDRAYDAARRAANAKRGRP